MNKRGVVSISTFSFIILILMSLFGTTYYFYESFKENIEVLNKEAEILNSINSFRSEILSIALENNSYLNYSNQLDSQDIILYTHNSKVRVELYLQENIIEKEVSLYGVNFCSNYSFSSASLTQFYFNSSCILVLES